MEFWDSLYTNEVTLLLLEKEGGVVGGAALLDNAQFQAAKVFVKFSESIYLVYLEYLEYH